MHRHVTLGIEKVAVTRPPDNKSVCVCVCVYVCVYVCVCVGASFVCLTSEYDVRRNTSSNNNT